MDAKTLDKLEYGRVREALARECACSLGRARAEAMTPSSDPAAVRLRLAETTEARRVLDTSGPVPLGGITDTEELMHRARVGSSLSASELLTVCDCLRGMRRLKEALCEEEPEDLPNLAELEARLSAFPEIEKRIEESLDNEGEVVDNASAELRRLRNRAAVLRNRIDEKLRAFLAKNASHSGIQDRLVTMRRGRPCVPVRAGSQRSFPGVVHDVSSSGATVFVEPEGVVGHGNELQQALAAEQEEVARILRELSGQVGARAEEMVASLEAAGLLDFIFARGSLSRRMDAAEPALRDDMRVRLMGARHPLIDPAKVVPIDLWAGEDFRGLLITGPNTGGKTVTLKTMGLLALMAQSGLHVPAEDGSELPVFRAVYADIGDDQSIVQSLSTFSSHMMNIAHICKKAGPGTLVLLDEVGAGTDPGEGAALAQAILRHLRDSGCIVLATTHYNSLKLFALNEEGMMNASVEFDADTLAPTYHLRIGVPGSSNAMTIASRLGLRSEIIAEAKSITGDDAQHVEKIVAKMNRARRQLERERGEFHRARREHEEASVHLTAEREALEAERERARKHGFEDARKIVREAREEAQRIIQSLRDQKREGKATQVASDSLATLSEMVEEEAGEAEPPQPPPAPFSEGDVVLVHSFGGKRAVVVKAEPAQKVRVTVGAVQLEIDAADLELVESAVKDQDLRDHIGALRVRKALAAPDEIHLRGMRVDEALAEMDKFLDDAGLAEHESVRIVHGKGTGALREAVRQYLRQHPNVRECHVAPLNEGGDGVTVAVLK